MKTRFLLMLGLVFLVWTQGWAEDGRGDARQLVVVTTADWDAVPGTLRRFERSNVAEPWREIGKEFPVVVGRNGLGWGRGLGPVKDRQGPVKKEGDGKSPAGVFRLSSAFGLAEIEKASWIKLPYQLLTSTIECVDDVKSSSYNLIVDRKNFDKVDWDSSEKMRAIGEQYRWGVFVDHNTEPRLAGNGSCIFLHVWKNSQTGTSGCTAMTRERMEELLRWLDPEKKPTLLQVPKAEFNPEQWKLPQR